MRSLAFKVLMAAAAMLGMAAPSHAALVSITGGSALNSIPTGNSVLGPAGITFAGGSIWQGGTLNITAPDAVTMTLYFVGSESGWNNQIRLDDDRAGVPTLRHTENFVAGTGGFYAAPYQLIGEVVQNPGVADIRFFWTDPNPDKFLVRNGSSAPWLGNGNGRASLAFAFLNELNEIVADPTNRILVLLDDAFGKRQDRDYDDYVGIIQFSTTPVPLPAAAWLLLSGLAGVGLLARRRG